GIESYRPRRAWTGWSGATGWQRRRTATAYRSMATADGADWTSASAASWWSTTIITTTTTVSSRRRHLRSGCTGRDAGALPGACRAAVPPAGGHVRRWRIWVTNLNPARWPILISGLEILVASARVELRSWIVRRLSVGIVILVVRVVQCRV